MCFAWPENIGYLLLLMPLALILGYGLMRLRQAREAVVGHLVAEGMIRGVSMRVVAVKKVLLFCGIALLLFAMAGPRFCSGGRPVLRKGADIVFMLDVSRSMRARDVLPDRLGQAKQEISTISRMVAGGRRALLLFAASPLVQCPLTTDQEAFDALLGMASPDLIEEQGTSFRAAFQLAGNLLEPQSGHGVASGVKGEKIVVLLSDGEDHAGELREAVQPLKEAGIHLFVIGVGMHQPVVIPAGEVGEQVKRDENGKVVMTSFRPETLQMLAGDAGGLYFRSRADQTVYGEVSDRINRIAAASRWVMESGDREPLYRYFLAAGILFLLVEFFTWSAGKRLR